jgi:hypothetical protein
MICPSQLNTPYRIDSRTKHPQRLSSPNLFRLRRSKPVLTVKPPLRRYGVEMPRVNLCVTLVVSPTVFHFISRGVPLHNIHLTTCPMVCRVRHACRKDDLSPLSLSPHISLPVPSRRSSACSQSITVHA